MSITDRCHYVALSLGCNEGDRVALMYSMETELRLFLTPPYKCSSLMETVAVDVTSMQPLYYNRIFCGSYCGTPQELLERCFQIELKLGRTGKGLREPRPADIDILLFDEFLIRSETLTIPHPQIFSRRYCTEGLNEAVPDWKIPGTSLTVSELYDTMELPVKKQEIRRIVPDCGLQSISVAGNV